MEENFSQRFEIVYKKYAERVEELGSKPSKLAFSRYVGVVQATMQRWEAGQVPGPKDLKTLHDKLGFSYDWLISGEGEPESDTPSSRLQVENENLKKEIQRLQTQIFVEGASDQAEQVAIGKTADQQR